MDIPKTTSGAFRASKSSPELMFRISLDNKSMKNTSKSDSELTAKPTVKDKLTVEGFYEEKAKGEHNRKWRNEAEKSGCNIPEKIIIGFDK